MGEAAVLARHLYKSYGKGKTKVKVLQDLDMTVARGTMYVTSSTVNFYCVNDGSLTS
jgi:ABC-type dipeptide/oligopeptide/nickel transport system ATPase subunit